MFHVMNKNCVHQSDIYDEWRKIAGLVIPIVKTNKLYAWMLNEIFIGNTLYSLKKRPTYYKWIWAPKIRFYSTLRHM